MKQEIDKDGIIHLTMSKAEYNKWQRQGKLLRITQDVDCPLTKACKWLLNYSEKNK